MATRAHTRRTPVMPDDLDNQMYEAMLDAVGKLRAFRAVDAAWLVLVEWARLADADDREAVS